MKRYNFENRDDFDACLRAFLAEYPTLQTESNAVVHQTGVDEIWMSTEGMVAFYDWARQRRYISGLDASRMITRMRELANAHHNQSQDQGETP
jgi:hypothetical protein